MVLHILKFEDCCAGHAAVGPLDASHTVPSGARKTLDRCYISVLFMEIEIARRVSANGGSVKI